MNDSPPDYYPAIEVRRLAKRFGDVEAVAGIDFDVRDGELFGFLGPNGAGKSTTINILIGLARPNAGTIRIGGIGCSTNPKAAQHLMRRTYGRHVVEFAVAGETVRLCESIVAEFPGLQCHNGLGDGGARRVPGTHTDRPAGALD